MKKKKLRLFPVTCILVMLLTIGMSFSPVKAADDCGYLYLELKTTKTFAEAGAPPEPGLINDMYLHISHEFGLYKVQGIMYGDGYEIRTAPFGSARYWYDSDTSNYMFTITLTGAEDYNPGLPDSTFFRPATGQITLNLDTQEGTFWSIANGFFEADWGQAFIRVYLAGDVLITRGYSKCFNIEPKPCSMMDSTDTIDPDFGDGCATISGSAFDGAYLWVSQRGATCGGTGDYIRKIDGDGNTLHAIPSPCGEVNTWGLAFESEGGFTAPTGLWVACDDSMLYKVSTTDGTILDPSPVDLSAYVGGARGLAYDGRMLWLASQEAEDGPGKLTAIDPRRGAYNIQFPAPCNHPTGIAFERYPGQKPIYKYLWLTDYESKKLYKLDRYKISKSEGFDIVCTYFLPKNDPFGLAWGLGPSDLGVNRWGVWVSDMGAGIYRMYQR